MFSVIQIILTIGVILLLLELVAVVFDRVVSFLWGPQTFSPKFPDSRIGLNPDGTWTVTKEEEAVQQSECLKSKPSHPKEASPEILTSTPEPEENSRAPRLGPRLL